MMKTYIFFLGVIAVYNSNTYTLKEINPVKFTSKDIVHVLEWLDGIPHAFDAHAVNDLAKVRFQLNAIQEGLIDKKTNKLVGRYIVHNKRYTLNDLTELEQNMIPEDEKNVFHQALLQALEDFGKIVGPFHTRVKGIKGFIVSLIEESCKMRHKTHSVLLDWGKCPQNEEQLELAHTIELAYKNGRGFLTLNEFITDLQIFFEDLKFNCPKACKQYEELKHKKAEHPDIRYT